jgi:hypothetical protein
LNIVKGVNKVVKNKSNSHTQLCFKCAGEGKDYRFEAINCITKPCNACCGKKMIDASYFRCYTCTGEGVTFHFDGKKEIGDICNSCKGKGFLTKPYDICILCSEEIQGLPVSGKKSTPRLCDKCSERASYPKENIISKSKTEVITSNDRLCNNNEDDHQKDNNFETVKVNFEPITTETNFSNTKLYSSMSYNDNNLNSNTNYCDNKMNYSSDAYFNSNTLKDAL